jgi:hypothetical protein
MRSKFRSTFRTRSRLLGGNRFLGEGRYRRWFRRGLAPIDDRWFCRGPWACDRCRNIGGWRRRRDLRLSRGLGFRGDVLGRRVARCRLRSWARRGFAADRRRGCRGGGDPRNVWRNSTRPWSSRSYEHTLRAQHRSEPEGQFDDGRGHRGSAIRAVARKPAGLPAIAVHRLARAGVAWRYIPPRPHADTHTPIFYPGAAVPWAISSRGHGDPGHADSAAVDIKAMQRPLSAHVRANRGAGREGTLLALAEDSIGLVGRRRENGLATRDPARERHHEQLVRSTSGSDHRECGRDENRNPISVRVAHASAPEPESLPEISSVPGPWRLCGALALASAFPARSVMCCLGEPPIELCEPAQSPADMPPSTASSAPVT